MHVRSGSGCLLSGPPVPSQELSQGILVKTLVSWLLEGRAQREAGLTEQRSPPAPGSGRITGLCHLDPHGLKSWSNWTITFFLFCNRFFFVL